MLNSGSENIEPRIQKQQDFFESAICRQKKTTNIDKGWSNKYNVKVFGQNQTLFEKVNFEKKITKTLKPFIKTCLRKIMSV